MTVYADPMRRWTDERDRENTPGLVSGKDGGKVAERGVLRDADDVVVAHRLIHAVAVRRELRRQ